MYPFEDFYNKVSQLPEPEKPTIDINFNQFSKDVLKQAIMNIDQMDEHSIAVLIKNNIETLSNDILHDDPSYSNVLRDPKFISSFIRAINSIPLDYTTKVACNKITYDYFTSDNPDPAIKQQYLSMSKTINRDAINKLMSIGLNENIASNLALSRYSSANERTNVKRLNFAIYHRDPSLMTEQMVVWIYEKLFNRISDLFQATMFEVYTPQQQEDFGENFMEVYGVVGLAVLIILNNMTSDNIRKVLIGYEAEWEYKGRPPVRFSLRALSGDYSRIRNVVEYMDSIGKHIP